MWHWGKKRSRISPWSHFVTDWNFRSIQICEVLMGTVWADSFTVFHLRDGYYHIARKSICFDYSLLPGIRNILFYIRPFVKNLEYSFFLSTTDNKRKRSGIFYYRHTCVQVCVYWITIHLYNQPVQSFEELNRNGRYIEYNVFLCTAPELNWMESRQRIRCKWYRSWKQTTLRICIKNILSILSCFVQWQFL